MRAAIAGSGRLVAVSNPLAARLSADLRLDRSRIATIPNGVRHERVVPASLRGELGLDAGTQLLVAVGNLYNVKGHRHLVDAIARLAGRYPLLHLAICGRGDLEGPLKAQAGVLGIADRVHVLGLRPDVPGVLAAADVFVHPSLSEGLPLALLEAMFAARPIVASDVGDVGTALAGGEAGVLVPAGDPSALAAAIARLLDDPRSARSLGDRAVRRAHAEYDVSQMVRRYVSIYRELLAAPALRLAS
jgi:glycosyltransferase involved in cell wall biosynthesis